MQCAKCSAKCKLSSLERRVRCETYLLKLHCKMGRAKFCVQIVPHFKMLRVTCRMRYGEHQFKPKTVTFAVQNSHCTVHFGCPSPVLDWTLGSVRDVTWCVWFQTTGKFPTQHDTGARSKFHMAHAVWSVKRAKLWGPNVKCKMSRTKACGAKYGVLNFACEVWSAKCVHNEMKQVHWGA